MAMLAAFASNYLFARMYGAALFGELQYALSLAYIVGSAALIFSAQSVSPILGRHTLLRHLVFYSAFRLRLSVTVLVFVIFSGIVLLIIRPHSLELTLIAGLAMFAEPISLGALMAYVDSRPWIVTRAKAYASSARVIWLYLAAHASLGAAVASIAWPIEACVAAAAPFFRYRALAIAEPRHLRNSDAVKRILIARGLKLWPAIAAGIFLLRIDRILLGSLISKAELGVYAAAASLVEQWNMMGATLALALAPKLVFGMRSGAEIRRGALMLGTYLAALAVAGSIGNFFIGRYVFLAIYGHAFESGISILNVAMFCSVVVFADSGFSAWLFAAKQYRMLLIKQILTVMAIVVSPFLFPRSYIQYSPSIGSAASLALFWLVLIVKTHSRAVKK
ncbi:hypothetical protein FAZ95_34600 [Trinickia violacea]|uniref:Lipopolysaccharide biosynthesis protein n=1 Tax=Trinickia violacea TaxID=2571746 RepID=A0A4P8IXJ1_9BURK|nr:hypothetical protein [Trinickia violacea]QCP54118.1 hypothetical protein FAZ95_34600 [Trinickia violacea]